MALIVFPENLSLIGPDIDFLKSNKILHCLIFRFSVNAPTYTCKHLNLVFYSDFVFVLGVFYPLKYLTTAPLLEMDSDNFFLSKFNKLFSVLFATILAEQKRLG